MIEPFTRHLDPRAALRAALGRDRGGTACLIGTQAAGKSIFAEYLRVRAPEGQHNRWSLGERFEAALGGIRLARVTPQHVVPLLEARPDATDASGPRIVRKSGSKSLTLWEPLLATERDRGTTFVDVPGEAASLIDPSTSRPVGLETAPVVEALREVIRASDVVVLFVPVWSLLPSTWLAANAVATLGPHLAATSLVGDPTVPTTEDGLESLCHITGAQTDAWKSLLESSLAPGAHLVVVLSQFQEEPVKKLFDAFTADTARARLGSETWERLDRVYRDARAPSSSWGALPRLAESLRAVDDAAFELIHATRAVAREREESSRVATALANLVAVPEAESVAAARMRARFGSVSMLPLNVVSIQSGDDCVQWNAGTRSPRPDHRGCEDVLWSMLLRRHAADLWEP